MLDVDVQRVHEVQAGARWNHQAEVCVCAMPKLIPCWLRERTPEERARERAHLAAMERREREAIAFGFKCRPDHTRERNEKR